MVDPVNRLLADSTVDAISRSLQARIKQAMRWRQAEPQWKHAMIAYGLIVIDWLFQATYQAPRCSPSMITDLERVVLNALTQLH